MKLLVVGVGGQVARSLVERARGSSVEVLSIGRPDVDLEIAGSAEQAILSEAPDIVVNSAAYTAVDDAEEEPERAFRINAEAAGEIAGAAARAQAPIIHLSTDYVFDGRASEPYREDAATAPLSVYGRSKLAGEERVRAANPHHLIIRTSWVYSPFGRNFVKTMLRLAGEKDEIAIVADQRGSPTSALDIADAVIGILDRVKSGASGTFHYAGRGICSWADVAEQIFAVSRALGGPNAAVRRISTSDYPTRAVRPAFSALDSGHFEAEFGKGARDWRNGVAEVVERLIGAS